ncbi:EAL domain-containing protein [Glaciecola sp. MF2-115]|uniref:EAL domain-containing protein n=1 Tax=Glaciecola sp. MF2-115 TaxID=3384827 RepID=UPI00399F40C8
MKKSWQSYSKSIVSKTLISVGIRIAIIITLLTLVSYWHLFSILEESKLTELRTDTLQRGARESQIFKLAEDNHQLLKSELIEQYKSKDAKESAALFAQLMVKQQDGAYRSNPELFDGTREAGAWIGQGVELTEDVKHRTILFTQLNTEYGKSWRNRFINTYILGPENFASSYWPEIPDFVNRLEGSFDIRQEEYFSISTPENNPSRESAWTGLYWDQQAQFWMVSVETPVYNNDSHIATIGNDIALDELISRTLESDENGYKLIFRSNGDLIASSRYLTKLKENSGSFKIDQEGDEQLQTIYKAVISGDRSSAIELDELGLYVFATKLDGPDWYYVYVVPSSILTKLATSTAVIVFLIGLLGLIVELLVLYSIMKKKIAIPLIELTQATMAISKGEVVSELNEQRRDELGRLARSFNKMRKRIDKRDREIVRNRNKFKNAFEHSPIGMAIVALDGNIIEANENLAKLLGYSESQLQNMKYSELLNTEAQIISEQKQADIIKGKLTSYEGERLFKRKDGSDCWCIINVSVQNDSNGSPEYAFIQSLNIEERKKAEVELNRLAYHDPLTGLANRMLLIEFLEQEIHLLHRHPEHEFAVLFLDLDGFKLVNDSLGHLAGDDLLKLIANRLKQYVRDTDVLARFGGDEFCVLVKEFEHEVEVIDIAQRINKTLSESFSICDEQINISASVGIVLANKDANTAEDYLRDADSAMYSAKQQGSGNYAIFNAAMHQNAKDELRLRNELTHAYENQEFTVYYQPIIKLETGLVSGFESLVRWAHPERGILTPDNFLYSAENMGLIANIDFWVLESAISQLVTWQETYKRKDLTINCNASSDFISDFNTVERVEALFDKYPLAPSCLNIEVTEGVLIHDTEKTLEILSELIKIGVNIHLDDFGTGYSSLNYLTRFPIDTLKIDRSFVNRIDAGSKDRAIIESIQLLASRLGIKVIAEGVETKEQYLVLKQIGVDCTQGYFHGKPAPVSDCNELLSSANNSNV